MLLSDGDPKNYMAYYNRATVFLAMGKSKSALPDLSKVIELKPDFTSVSFCFYITWFEIELNNSSKSRSQQKTHHFFSVKMRCKNYHYQ